jgi:glycosyltransferase involved in cell wall biosynthesis
MNNKVLITTPDYPPNRIGGISTFVINLEKVLKSQNIPYDLLVWNTLGDLSSKELSSYRCIINAHFHSLLKIDHNNMITFVHGGELFSYSKNPIKRIIKSILHKRILKSLKKSEANIFVSVYSLKLYNKLLGETDYEKNKVFHNCIDLNESEFINKDIDSEIKLCCFVRDVPHKNIAGTLALYRELKSKHNGKVSLTITANVDVNDPDIRSIPNATDADREEIMKESHLNLLLSLDHSHLGNIEGFGLTVLEAGKYGVPTLGLSNGGLVESIHHLSTGLLVDQLDDLYLTLQTDYRKLSLKVHEHTHESHGLDVMSNFIKAYL